MRPERLEVEGFTAFRHRTVVDFGGAELFALCGPTGSGKSSLVDAMVFALYGTVPRLDRRAVAPVISLGASEAKVRLDFSVGSADYTAVRVVRRTRAGATTKEARLERAGEVIAGNADELTERVTELLGLTYDHFVKCVVLPQGEFAAFLHDSGADRGNLLVKLLDLGIYERMAAAARRRHGEASNVLHGLKGQLKELEGATAEAVAEAAARLESLEKLADRASGWTHRIAALQLEVADADRAEQQARQQQRLLAAVEMPAGVVERAAELAAGREAVAAAEARHAAATERMAAAERRRAELPERSVLEAADRAHADLVATHRQREAEEQAAAAAAADLEAAAAAHEAAAERAAQAAAALEAAQWEHRAHALAARLVEGQPCPVCAQPVRTLPALAAEGADPIASAEGVKRRADAECAAAEQRLSEARRTHTQLDTSLARTREQIAQLQARVEAWPDRNRLQEVLAAVTAAEADVRAAGAEARAAAEAAVQARQRATELERASAADAAAFEAARDSLAVLGPPPADRSDLGEAWLALAQWAADRVEPAATAVDEARRRLAALREEVDAVRREASETLAAAALDPGGSASDPAQVVANAIGAARTALGQLRSDAARAEVLRGQAVAAERAAQLAQSLGQHLAANRFENWVLDDALAELTAGATELLRSLSSGAYSLALDERRNFAVIDHRNADEMRSARTLSGGETFLASRARALALADQVGSLARGGAARIESIFLDEGFGTLDPDTLDTVASAIEELGAHGRMVGLISHVTELAERMPVRFVVSRDLAGSVVEKVVS